MAHALGKVGSQGITWAGRMVSARLMTTQRWQPPASVHQEQGGLSRGPMASTSPSVWEKAAPPAFNLKPDNPVPLHMSLVPFELWP